jgi:hypothetical protein
MGAAKRHALSRGPASQNGHRVLPRLEQPVFNIPDMENHIPQYNNWNPEPEMSGLWVVQIVK